MYYFVETTMTHIHTYTHAQKMDCLDLFLPLWEEIHLVFPPYHPLSLTHTHKHTQIHTSWSNYKHFQRCGPSSLTQHNHPSLPYLIFPCSLSPLPAAFALCVIYTVFLSSWTHFLSRSPFPPLSISTPQTDIIWGNGNWFSATRFPPSLCISLGLFSYLCITITIKLSIPSLSPQSSSSRYTCLRKVSHLSFYFSVPLCNLYTFSLQPLCLRSADTQQDAGFF